IGEMRMVIWLDYNGNKTDIEQCINELTLYDIQIGQQWVYFPEHAAGLIKASARTLSYSLLYTVCLSELRIPRDLADFFTYAVRSIINGVRSGLPCVTPVSNRQTETS